MSPISVPSTVFFPFFIFQVGRPTFVYCYERLEKSVNDGINKFFIGDVVVGHLKCNDCVVFSFFHLTGIIFFIVAVVFLFVLFIRIRFSN